VPLSNLNQEQLEAVHAPLGFNLVVASAGTGKTSTIVARISHLINSGMKPEEILLLTFTNKAAHEMVSRVGAYFGETDVLKIEAGTFHATSYRLLKSFGKQISLKKPKELKLLFKSVYEKRDLLSIDATTKPYSAGYLFDEYSYFLNSTNLPFDEWMSEKNEEHTPFIDLYEDIFNEYTLLKEEYGYVSFDDLLIMMKNELNYRKLRFKEILVDEYQDTNILQNMLINAFKPKSLFCVGDYDQSIYAFNGSDINIIGSFAETYKDAKVFTLRKNYRSSSKILDLANSVISHNKRLYPKKLEVVRDGNFDEPKLIIYDELFEQYKGIAKKIQDSYTPIDNISVIFRNNSSADGIEASLRDLGIKSKRRGGVGFFDSKEIKAILDIITLYNYGNDMMSFIHIFEYVKGVGYAIAKDIFEALMRLGDGSINRGLLSPNTESNVFEKKIKNVQLGLFDEFVELGSIGRFKHLSFSDDFLSNAVLKHPKLSEDGAMFLFEYYKLIKNLKNKNRPNLIIESVSSSYNLLYIKNILSNQRATRKDGSIDSEKKEISSANIERKFLILKDLSSHYKSITSFLNSMVLGSSEMGEDGGVNLFSIHASKGLEFTEVYIADLMNGRFPNLKLMQKSGSLEEERRLFYVAVTRAKDILYLSYAKYDRIKKIDYVPSQFLYESGMLNR
jgi:DNA helicase-2/ATP-dependent DNA helicase PcrA